MLNGRQLALLVDNHFKLSEVGEQLLDFEDLSAVELRGDNAMAFQKNGWGMTISGLRNMPDEYILESLYNKQFVKCQQLNELLALYNQHTVQKQRSRVAMIGW